MLNVVQHAVVDYLTRARTSGRLPGLKTVQFGDAPVPTEKLPAVTIEWDGKVRTKVGSHVEVTADFELSLYAASMKSQAEADQQVNDLVMRATGNQWTGIVPVLAKLTGYTDDNGQSYKIKPIGDVLVGTLKQGGVYESVAILKIQVETWLNLSQL